MSNYAVVWNNGNILTGLTRQGAFHIYNSEREQVRYNSQNSVPKRVAVSRNSVNVAVLIKKEGSNSWVRVKGDNFEFAE